MKIKKMMKITYILIILIILLTPISNVQAGSPSSGAGTINPDDYKPNDLTALDYQKPFSFAKTILSAVTITGVVICIITVMFLGMKYMVGSVEEKAEYKKTMIPIIVGMIMLACTSTIVSIIFNIVNPLNN